MPEKSTDKNVFRFKTLPSLLIPLALPNRKLFFTLPSPSSYSVITFAGIHRAFQTGFDFSYSRLLFLLGFDTCYPIREEKKALANVPTGSKFNRVNK